MRTMICFRTPGGIGRHPVEDGADADALRARLGVLVPHATEWWTEQEELRGAAVVEDDT